MMSRWKSSLFAGAAVFALIEAAAAQSPPQPTTGQPAPAAAQTAASPGQTPAAAATLAPVAGTGPLYNPDQLPAQRGRVQQFTLSPRGDIDGLILADGTEVKTPPHLSTQIAYSIKPGDNVIIHGLHAAALPLIQAASITDEATGRTVIDNGPPGPGPGPAPPLPPVEPEAGPSAPIPGLSEVQGRVRMVLHGPRGDVNGALLEDGTVLRLPPPEAYRFTNLLQPGQALVAEGSELVSAVGTVVEMRQLGPTQTQLSLVAEPPGRGRRRPPPPGLGAAPAAPPRP